jgi:hypothetical protein
MPTWEAWRTLARRSFPKESPLQDRASSTGISKRLAIDPDPMPFSEIMCTCISHYSQRRLAFKVVPASALVIYLVLGEQN